MAAKAEKTGSSVSCFNSSKSYDAESATTEGKGKKSFFQKLLGTKTKKIVGIAIASIVVATLAAVTVALAASLGANSPGENIDPPVNETLGSGEIPTVNGTGLPTVNSTETPVIPTGAQPETPTINPTDPSLVSLCGYRPDVAMESVCVARPISFFETLNTEGMSELELKGQYALCASLHTSDPCNDVPTFSTVTDLDHFPDGTDHLPDGIIYAFAEQGRNSTLPVLYDAGTSSCFVTLGAFVF